MKDTLREKMGILAIETSCDDTSVAYFCFEKGLVGQRLASQSHAQYGGVMPEMASRDHQKALLPMVQALCQSYALQAHHIDAVAYTAGPGLIGSLLVGASVAKALAIGWQCPLLPIHHLEGHICASFLENPDLSYPFLALLVSGGHSLFVWVESLGHYQVIGQSLDDAVGEAFDKTARLLGLGFPGGAALSALAQSGEPRYDLPRPLCQQPHADMSFSGLKTAVYQLIQKVDTKDYPDVAASFEVAAIDTLMIKTKRALRSTNAPRLVVGGGVACNQRLRQSLQGLDVEVIYPSPVYCTDNAAMIACAASLRWQAQCWPQNLPSVTARWSLASLA